MELDQAELMMKKLLLHNKLISEEQFDDIVGDAEAMEGKTLPQALVAKGSVAENVVAKIQGAVEAKGNSFRTHHTETVSMADGSEDGGSALSLADDSPSEAAPSYSEYQASEWQSEDDEADADDDDDDSLSEEGVANPVGDGQRLIAMLAEAKKVGGSDFHVNVSVPPFLRKFGKLVRMQGEGLTPQQTEAMLFDVLTPSQQARARKDLQLDFCLRVKDGSRYRANLAKDRQGWIGCFRIIPDKVPTFQELGLPAPLKTLTEYGQGLVLVTGPRGCGKTTTLAAMVDLINANRKDHIITIEDPIEYSHAPKGCRVTQRSLGSHTLSYANAMKAALREDPDIIMVGELRDLDTTSMAITAAETGHLVLASMHTASADRTIDRLIDTFPPDQQAQIRAMVAESIRGIVCQNLLPSTDGKSMVPAMEILLNNNSVRKMIIDGRTFQLESVIQTGKKQGMIRMVDSIEELVSAGKVSAEAAKEHAG